MLGQHEDKESNDVYMLEQISEIHISPIQKSQSKVKRPKSCNQPSAKSPYRGPFSKPEYLKTRIFRNEQNLTLDSRRSDRHAWGAGCLQQGETEMESETCFQKREAKKERTFVHPNIYTLDFPGQRQDQGRNY